MAFKPLLALILLLTASVATPAQAQNKFTLTTINVVGLSHYTPSQVIQASGLHPNTPIELSDLQPAVDRLANSGAFDSVKYRYSTRGTDLIAEFDVVETKNTLTCIFDNFVWFSAADLDKLLREQVPFYDGKLPERGDSSAEARDVLQAALREKNVPGDVSFMPYAPPNSPISALLFRVDGAPIPIKAISFTGAAKVTPQQLADAAKGLIGQNFSSVDVSSYAHSGLLPLYHQRGYLRAAFGRANVALIDPSAKGPSYDVAVTLPVEEGDQYSLSSIDWRGNQAVSSSELAQAFGMAPHDVANLEKVAVGFNNANRLYGSRGYINASVMPHRDLDDAAKVAAYSVQINEGHQYRMGTISFDGIPETVAATLTKQWKLKPGDIYNSEYITDFITKVALPELARQGYKQPHITQPKLTPDPDTLRVNLYIHIQ